MDFRGVLSRQCICWDICNLQHECRIGYKLFRRAERKHMLRSMAIDVNKIHCQSGVWIGQGLGYGQTWQNMLGSAVGCASVRAVAVSCVNSTGRPIVVRIVLRLANEQSYAVLWIGGVSLTGFLSHSNWMTVLEGIVPPGSSYVLTINPYTLNGLDEWRELR